MGLFDNVKNIFGIGPTTFDNPNADKSPVRNLSNTIFHQQFDRVRQDIDKWRAAVQVAELAYWPQRVDMQKLYIDTVLNGHVSACIERRKDLTLLRDFGFFNDDVENEDLTKLFKSTWFTNFMSYAIDSIFYGYTLVSLGDINTNQFNDLSNIQRWNVSPDRLNVSTFIYGTVGENFLDEPYADWHVWIPTPSDNGAASCGYGLLYTVGMYEIYLRNIMGYNSDFVELYSQPYRVGKTNKTEGIERDNLEGALRSMGSNGYALLDPTDSIEFLETNLGGTGWQGYDNLEKRCEQKISKIILGHADALDSVPGKLGAGQGETESPVAQALSQKQSKDGRFIEDIVNRVLIPKLINLGFAIPQGVTFQFKNDDEKQEIKTKEDASNLQTSQIALTMFQAGLQMDAAYFEERTGIKSAPVPPPPAPVMSQSKGNNDDNLAQSKGKKVANHLMKLYK